MSWRISLLVVPDRQTKGHAVLLSCLWTAKNKRKTSSPPLSVTHTLALGPLPPIPLIQKKRKKDVSHFGTQLEKKNVWCCKSFPSPERNPPLLPRQNLFCKMPASYKLKSILCIRCQQNKNTKCPIDAHCFWQWYQISEFKISEIRFQRSNFRKQKSFFSEIRF